MDAVEIDPQLARIGRDFHPEGVYADPRVTVHVNDGRAFLNSNAEKYDLVIYALTDSLTLVSSTPGVRLESFLFTEESLAQAREHLAGDGVSVMYNLYREPWLVTRLGTMIGDVFGHEPLVRMIGSAEAVLAAGPAVEGLGAQAADRSDALPRIAGPVPVPATDDWPFLYLRAPGVAPYYLAGLAFMLAFALAPSLGAARASGTSVRRFSPHFFVLGVAFLLLETKSLITFSLLFGTTWLVNALVFFAILASVLAAIFVTPASGCGTRGRSISLSARRSPWPTSVSADALLLEPAELRYAIAAAGGVRPRVLREPRVHVLLPRHTCCRHGLRLQPPRGDAGGALEYVALVTGFRALLLLVAALYGLAFILVRVRPILADRELSLAGQPGGTTN